MEETTCLLDLAGKYSVMASVQVPVKGIVREREVFCWMEKRAVYMPKARGDSWGLKKSEGSHHHPI